MEQEKLGTPQKHPEFSQDRFAALNTELKQLYVAITRTRQILVIIDENREVKKKEEEEETKEKEKICSLTFCFFICVFKFNLGIPTNGGVLGITWGSPKDPFYR